MCFDTMHAMNLSPTHNQYLFVQYADSFQKSKPLFRSGIHAVKERLLFLNFIGTGVLGVVPGSQGMALQYASQNNIVTSPAILSHCPQCAGRQCCAVQRYAGNLGRNLVHLP